MSGTDLSTYLKATALKLCGDRNEELSTKDEWRYGTNGSLSVIIAGPKRGSWYDHENKLGGGTLELINHKLGKSNGEAIAWLQDHLGLPRKKTIQATYDYVDEDGRLLFQVVRFEPKEFRQRRPDGSGWAWNLRGARIVPYRLPALLAAVEAARAVYVVEGEKDVDVLLKLGIAATCNPMGAGKWRSSFAPYFQGADVVVVPDNDDAGRAHAQAVARSLAPMARRLRYVTLPDLPPKGDVSDWLAAGGTTAALASLTEAAPLFAEDAADGGEAASDDVGLGEWDAGEDDAPISPRGWLLGNIFCRGFVSSIVADGGVGKTALRIAQLISLACGRSLTGEYVFQRCRVLIVSLEDDADELRRRVRAAMVHHAVKPEEVRGWLYLAALGFDGGKLATTEGGSHKEAQLAARLIDVIEARAIDVVSLDPFVKAHGVEENANNAVDFVASILARIAIDHDCAVDAPHHTSKGPADAGNANRGRGASAFKDAARLVYTLSPMSEEEAARLGVTDADRRSLVRMDAGKVNIAPPATQAKWFKLVGVKLNNGTDLYPHGDDVQTVETWDPPDLWKDVTSGMANLILTEIEQGLPGGGRYSAYNRSGDRDACHAVKKHLPALTDEQAREMVKTWLKNGTLYYDEYHDPELRKERKGLFVNATKRPG